MSLPMPQIPPWRQGPLKEWLIVGMNHYLVNGQRHLYVAMIREGACIKEEGLDDEYLWNRLWHKAVKWEEFAHAGEDLERECGVV